MIRFALLAALTSGCLRTTEYKCTSNDQCGANGVCEPGINYCSFPDSTCGRKFGDSAGALANTCVGGNPMTDGGIDAPMHADGSADAMIDGGGGPCPGFQTLSGQTHRYKSIAATDWDTAKMTCSSFGGVTYLAVPDSMPENDGLKTIITTGKFWIGIFDNQGNVTTVKGTQDPTYQNWAANQPSTSGGAKCAEEAATNPMAGKWEYAPCSDSLTAICECEP